MGILSPCPTHGDTMEIHGDMLRCSRPRCTYTQPLPESLRLARLGPATAPRLM